MIECNLFNTNKTPQKIVSIMVEVSGDIFRKDQIAAWDKPHQLFWCLGGPACR